MSNNTISTEYHYDSRDAPHLSDYLMQPVINICRELGAKKILDLGCGNGVLCNALSEAGFEVIGCDPSKEGIEIAREAYPHIPFYVCGIYDDPSTTFEREFDLVISTEVVEHVSLPRFLPEFASKVLSKGGHLVLSTPYHGYLKNLALAVSGKMDAHFTVLWDGGHIKFWSRATLSYLLHEGGFHVQKFVGAGRIPYFWKSMILIAKKDQ